MSTSTQLTTKRNQETKDEDGQPQRTIAYTVDGEPQKTMETPLTARNIMTAASVDPKTHYLVQVFGHNEQVSFKGRASEAIEVQENARFLTVSTGPTPVS